MSGALTKRTMRGFHIRRGAFPICSEKSGQLEGQRERMGYIELRRRGLPRGSGGIESANKLICHVRLKRSGAWWLEAKGNAMLRIRCALYNGTFDKIFADYMSARDAADASP